MELIFINRNAVRIFLSEVKTEKCNVFQHETQSKLYILTRHWCRCVIFRENWSSAWLIYKCIIEYCQYLVGFREVKAMGAEVIHFNESRIIAGLYTITGLFFKSIWYFSELFFHIHKFVLHGVVHHNSQI